MSTLGHFIVLTLSSITLSNTIGFRTIIFAKNNLERFAHIKRQLIYSKQLYQIEGCRKNDKDY